MAVIDSIKKAGGNTAFSFEVLPPLKGAGIAGLFSAIDKLKEFKPLHINITTHRREISYRELPDGMFERCRIRRRPGTAAVAAAICARYDIPVVPHVICSGYTQSETEYLLLDLQYLGITDLLVLRGDKARDESAFVPQKNGWAHALQLEEQINAFNRGIFADGSPIKTLEPPFHYGVAGYPEKHEEAPNMADDIFWLKKKVDAGAEYVVTQMFYDNAKFLQFVKRARKAGITVPVIPGIKPFSRAAQLNVLPKTFKVDIPQALVREVKKCKNDDAVRAVGIEWGIAQCRELKKHGVPSIHFYSSGAVDCVRKIAEAIY